MSEPSNLILNLNVIIEEYEEIEELIKEFYANMARVRGITVCVKGKWISFSREKINENFNLKEHKGGSKFKKLLKEPEYQKIVDLLTDGKGKWKVMRK